MLDVVERSFSSHIITLKKKKISRHPSSHLHPAKIKPSLVADPDMNIRLKNKDLYGAAAKIY